jgi:hypothetical protein
MPRVVNNITRAETIQLDLGIGDARLIRLNSLRISSCTPVASNIQMTVIEGGCMVYWGCRPRKPMAWREEQVYSLHGCRYG